jgi:cyclopropane-fatty-acyl-phospholipid synthase
LFFIVLFLVHPPTHRAGAANSQHYMIPTSFYKEVLGPYMKYSCGYWPKPDTTFEESEVEMLNLYCQRAELQDGMKARTDLKYRGAN